MGRLLLRCFVGLVRRLLLLFFRRPGQRGADGHGLLFDRGIAVAEKTGLVRHLVIDLIRHADDLLLRDCRRRLLLLLGLFFGRLRLLDLRGNLGDLGWGECLGRQQLDCG